jgi:predicted O-methyltransferase YrrM
MEDLGYVRSPARLRQIEARTTELQFAMASEPLVGALLRTLAASKPGGCFLELGTGTGIATAWLLDGMDAESTLISVDNDGSVQEVARDVLESDARLTLVRSGGLEFLDAQPAASFDFVFANAMPGSMKAWTQLLLS